MEPALTTADDLAAKMHDVMTLDDAEIARLKCVAASGKVYDAEGRTKDEKPPTGCGCTTALERKERA